MTNSREHICIEKEQLSNQSRKIAELEARADYKDKRVDEMNTKLDKLIDSFNEFKMESTHGDTGLELRLKAIETELAIQKQSNIDNHNRLSNLLALVGVGLTVITILINVYFNMIH